MVLGIRGSKRDLAHVKARFSARQNLLCLAVYPRQHPFRRTSEQVLAHVKLGLKPGSDTVLLSAPAKRKSPRTV